MSNSDIYYMLAYSLLPSKYKNSIKIPLDSKLFLGKLFQIIPNSNTHS